MEILTTQCTASNMRFGATAAVTLLFPQIIACKPIKNATFATENIFPQIIACKPIKNATFATENIFKESNHAK